MADGPTPDSDERSASYSPPPNHRPGWMGDGWGSRSGGERRGVTGGWSRTQAGSPDPGASGMTTTVPSRAGRRTTSRGGGAQRARRRDRSRPCSRRLGTYGVLLGTGQLDRQRATLNPPRGLQTSTSGNVPEQVRIVEESADHRCRQQGEPDGRDRLPEVVGWRFHPRRGRRLGRHLRHRGLGRHESPRRLPRELRQRAAG